MMIAAALLRGVSIAVCQNAASAGSSLNRRVRCRGSSRGVLDRWTTLDLALISSEA
jgi:hypothetical protein